MFTVGWVRTSWLDFWISLRYLDDFLHVDPVYQYKQHFHYDFWLRSFFEGVHLQPRVHGGGVQRGHPEGGLLELQEKISYTKLGMGKKFPLRGFLVSSQEIVLPLVGVPGVGVQRGHH